MCFLTRVITITILPLISFPGETLERGIQNAIILESDEALVLHAQEEFDDILPDG